MQKLTSIQRRTMSLKAIGLFRHHLFKRNKKLNQVVDIHIRFVKLEEDEFGICDNHDVGIKSREFTIYINRDLTDIKDIITTVAHEMVHVWQYATGKFRDYASPSHRYENFIYNSDMSYKDMPWEIEARQLEKVLYKLWLDHNNK
jgi:hypothetical protein